MSTINARPISFAEIEAIATGDAPSQFAGYALDRDGELTPMTFEVRPTLSRKWKSQAVPHEVVHAAIPSNRPDRDMIADPGQPVGYRFRLDTQSIFGGSGEMVLYTSEDAEDSYAILRGVDDPGKDRARLYVADAHAPALPLAPVYGSQVTVSAVVADLDPDTLAARVEKALVAEFGPALGRHRKVLTRPVADHRVDVFDAADGTPLAIGILAAEVPSVMRGNRAVRTERSRTDLIVGS